MGNRPGLKPLGWMDAYQVRLESPATHMHTASVMTFRRPENASADYVRELYELLATLPYAETTPYCYRLYRGRRWLWPSWEVTREIDVDHHLRLSKLPAPGGERQFTEFVAKLHSERLDFSRPLWECHVIDGLAGGRFAVYLKMHHALADGGTVVRLITAYLSEGREPFSLELAQDKRRQMVESALAVKPGAKQPEPNLFAATWLAAGVFVKQLKIALRHQDPEIVAPYVVQGTPFDVRIGAERCYGIQAIPIGPLRELHDRSHSTINDLVLASCAGALRRYLAELDALPERPLTVSVAVALERAVGHADEGNDIAGVYMALPTHLEQGPQRIAFCRSSMDKAKQMILTMPKRAIEMYLKLTSVPFAVMEMSGLGIMAPPYSDVTISNVPGPRQQLYFHGAALEHMYPASVIFNRQGLNITVRSCSDWLNIGVVSCAEAVPEPQRLADYVVDAFAELAHEFGMSRNDVRISGRADGSGNA